MSIEPKGRPSALEALEFGLNKLSNARHARRALIVIANGLCSGTGKQYDKVQRIIRTSDIAVYFVRMHIVQNSRDVGPNDCGSDLVEESGGIFLAADQGTILKAMGLISREFSTQYEIAAVPDAKAKTAAWNKASIRLVLTPERDRALGKTFIKGNRGFYY